ncbi:MAG: cell envelope integrity protein CreD [Rikenellaceae bacterium]|jgi:inner membrane protein|nr:cell envelope integrity protein CreD [Rikenellaceae bacterium]
MEKPKRPENFSRMVTIKAIIILVLTLLMLIPQAMIRGLIEERKDRCETTVRTINSKWSDPQTLCGPVVAIPCSRRTVDNNNKVRLTNNTLYLTPSKLDIKARITPDERHYGIYKSILYKSEIELSGEFDRADLKSVVDGTLNRDKARVIFGLSDLKGMVSNAEFSFGEASYSSAPSANFLPLDVATEVVTVDDYGRYSAAPVDDVGKLGRTLMFNLTHSEMTQAEGKVTFRCRFELKGSSHLDFVPVGQSTTVDVSGDWPSPSFTGSFSPESEVTDKSFSARWSVLRYNRNIPVTWVDDQVGRLPSFGVSLIEPVDHYLQNERSAKYASMFVILTFVLFFFVEILTRKRIHPIQYLLVGFALLLFYSLLLSISEQIGFTLAYLVASVATIALITAYVRSIFRSGAQTAILAAILTGLYVFLYVILQLEDVALLIGSVGLFVILGAIMYASRKVNWYKSVEDDPTVPPALP